MNITKKKSINLKKKYNKISYKYNKYLKKKNTKKKVIKKNKKKKNNYTKKYQKFRNKKSIYQKGGDSFTDTVNLAESVGTGVNLVDLAGSITAGIAPRLAEKSAKVGPVVVEEEAEAAPSPQAEEEQVSQTAFCKMLQSGVGTSSIAAFGGLATGALFGAPLIEQANELFTKKSTQDSSVSNYANNVSAANASKGTANDAANNTTNNAKAQATKNNQEEE